MRARRARAETELPGRIVVHRSQGQHTPLTAANQSPGVLPDAWTAAVMSASVVATFLT
jgi:hypothetical protein